MVRKDRLETRLDTCTANITYPNVSYEFGKVGENQGDLLKFTPAIKSTLIVQCLLVNVVIVKRLHFWIYMSFDSC